ncbi:NUMOD1 domain-containing DNA-binding protein [Oceanirhabdus seepicola]|uniref:Nuclease-associated modular DNA-binding 1 domain-containing protein n=1 Tax=Oceanirhabdus seepicola TaxID=2828781 RepID=A0A9J6P199_9CLOT|nr:NUMOD1 domain-containing DNA-binding protein [Oceanirhabdus seepicola]MCM1990188.1 hypothetical protein [Oceanirhabdus seepicola]
MKRYSQDNSYFKKIDTERKAYWLGFLYADGCISEISENNKKIIIQLHPDDKYILEELLNDINSDRPIYVNKKGYVSINIASKEMANDLIKLGCVPRKSLVLKFPSEIIVPCELIKHFIRGYMDGDGCISTYKKARKNRKSLIFKCEIKFIGTYDMLYGIKVFFSSDKDILINKHSPKSCQISFSGRKYREVVDALYNGATIYLKRKKDKWDEFVKYMNDIDTKKEYKESRLIVKLDNDANYLGEYTVKYLKNEFNIGSILKCCEYREKHKSYKNFRWIYLDEYKTFIDNCIDIKDIFDYKKVCKIEKSKVTKTVKQYDLNEKLIKIWKDAKTAADYYNTTSKAIRKVCNGERKTCCNFIWKYSEPKKSKQSKVVNQYDIDGNLINVWNSCKEASVFYNVTFQSIQRAISGKYKTCCGFVWRYR